jgi:outer membrane receptor protein involved in Fe transport
MRRTVPESAPRDSATPDAGSGLDDIGTRAALPPASPLPPSARGLDAVARSTKSLRLLLALPAAIAASAPALAADGAGAASEPIPEIVVVGTTPLPGADIDRRYIAAPLQTATAEDIDRNHVLDLTAFMNRSLGSVYVNDVQNNPLQPDINYRGYAASPLLGTPQGVSVYLDGMRLNQPFGDVVSWDLVPLAAISSLTLMPGSNPLFGLNTLGGALALRTKDGFSAPGYALELNYGSNDRRQLEVEAGGHANSGLYWYATANRLEDDGWRDSSPTDASQLFAKVGWRNDATDIALTGAAASTDLTGNGLQDQQFLAHDYASVYTKPDDTDNDASLFNLVATHRFNDRVTFSANAYYRRVDTDTLNGDINDDSLGENLYQPTPAEQAALTAAGYTGFPTSGETQANTPFPYWRCIANILLNTEPNEKCNGLHNETHTRQHESGLSAQATFASELGTHVNRFTGGIALLESMASFTQTSRFGYLTRDRSITTVDGPGAFADGTQDSENAFDARVDLTGKAETHSVYLTDTVELARTVQLTLSGRYDRTTIDNTDHLTPDESDPGSLTGEHEFSRFNPAVGVTVSPNDRLTAYVGYNEGSRAPSAIELGCADPDNPCRLPNAMAGDPPLDQVVTHTFEAGLRGVEADGLAWRFGLFRADNHDDILFVANDVSGFGYFKNFGKTRRQGVEVALQTTLGAFDFGGNYTFLEATYRSAEQVAGAGNSSNDSGPGFEGLIDVEPGDRIPLVPRSVFKAFAEWRVGSRVSVHGDLLLVGGSFARGNENNAHEPDGIYYSGSGETSGYTVLNAGVEIRPTAALTLFAQVDNLLDREYYTAAQLGATGFNSLGNFVARPFAGPIVDGERPLLGSTFYAPGAPRAFWLGVRYAFGAR